MFIVGDLNCNMLKDNQDIKVLKDLCSSLNLKQLINARTRVTSKSSTSIDLIPEPTARSAVPGVSPGRGLLIPHGYLHPGKSEHSEVKSPSMIAGASLWSSH